MRNILEISGFGNLFLIDPSKRLIEKKNNYSCIDIYLLSNLKVSGQDYVQLYIINGSKYVIKYSLVNSVRIQKEYEVVSKLKTDKLDSIDGVIIPEALEIEEKDSGRSCKVLMAPYCGKSLNELMLNRDFFSSDLTSLVKQIGQILRNVHNIGQLNHSSVNNSVYEEQCDNFLTSKVNGLYWQKNKILKLKKDIKNKKRKEIINEINILGTGWTHGDFFPYQIVIGKPKTNSVSIIDWGTAYKGYPFSDLLQFWVSFELSLLFSGYSKKINELLQILSTGYNYDLNNSLYFKIKEIETIARFSTLHKLGQWVIPRTEKWKIKSGKSVYFDISFWKSLYLHNQFLNSKINELQRLIQ